ncbi:hypothetical protein ACIQNG_07895 [Streptomyces sp. NPDC091377]|uniref:hypothetical protein n=1 Tax=unclassified Streptomyces TaxID=2593676 RepID=UPI00381BE4D1
MESRLQHKLRERRERAALEAVEAGLGALLTGDALAADAVPEWATRAIDRSRSIHTEPDELLPDTAPPGELDAWIERLLTAQGMGDRLYVASHVGLRPWLECQVPATGWTARLRSAVEEPWMFLSGPPGSDPAGPGPLDRLVIVAEAEYYFEAYTARRN